jgi:UDP-glucose 4-epimerase
LLNTLVDLKSKIELSEGVEMPINVFGNDYPTLDGD